MTTTSIPSYVSVVLKQEIIKIQHRMLFKISEDYEIDFDELVAKYTDTRCVDGQERVDIVRKRDYNKNLDQANRCTALNAKGDQCKRSIIQNTPFCVVHRDKQPSGCVRIKGKSRSG